MDFQLPCRRKPDHAGPKLGERRYAMKSSERNDYVDELRMHYRARMKTNSKRCLQYTTYTFARRSNFFSVKSECEGIIASVT